jgi:hypothetical protein
MAKHGAIVVRSACLTRAAPKGHLAMNRIVASLPGGPMKTLKGLLVLALCWMWSAGAAHACSCDPISPEAGFERAQYVFAGKVVQAEHHTWLVEVERVWKGHENLGRTVRLMDVYARMECEFFFHLGQRYLVFAVVAKGGREVFYHPQACNWTRPLQSTRVPVEGNEPLWVEDLVAREHGPGEPPRDER